jgi:ABC-type glycerol-3-phosphate transport system permease component
MPIISTIGRRHWRTRLLIGAIYTLLTAGALTMVYPFLLMLSGSTKSAADSAHLRAVPPFLLSDTELYRKYVEGLFNEWPGMYQAVCDSEAGAFQLVEPPASPDRGLARLWREFLASSRLPDSTYTIGFVQTPLSRGVFPHLLRAWKDELSRRYGGDIVAMNADLESNFASWSALNVVAEDFLLRLRNPDPGPLHQAFRAFKAARPMEDRYYFSVDGYYRMVYLRNRYGRSLEQYNAAHGTRHATWRDIPFPERAPPPGPARDDWEPFVRTLLNLQWIRADESALPAYRRYLRAKYGQVSVLNERYGSSLGSFDDAAFPGYAEGPGLALTDLDALLQGWKDPQSGEAHLLPLASIRVVSVNAMFREFLRGRFATIGELNRGLGSAHRDWDAVQPPQEAFHYERFLARRGWLRWEFARRNFVTVWDYIVLHGRGVRNTAIYCLLSVACALIVNPIAAYALSRFRPPSTYKVLLFLMLTMAFPPMVNQIPVFLMLRRLDLLNTFWALVLPGLASGYSIFLLKGFFDSLPRELYESAEIDGASEFTIFWQITMSLSRPILAVVALNAFTHAYASFMYALLICQDPGMWTLMPWLYQLQQMSGPGVVYASLLVAAIPTLVVFTLCQQVIIRGIVVPVEK